MCELASPLFDEAVRRALVAFKPPRLGTVDWASLSDMGFEEFGVPCPLVIRVRAESSRALPSSTTLMLDIFRGADGLEECFSGHGIGSCFSKLGREKPTRAQAVVLLLKALAADEIGKLPLLGGDAARTSPM